MKSKVALRWTTISKPFATSAKLSLGLILITEGIIEIAVFYILRHYRHVVWILIDEAVTLVLGIVVCARWPPDELELIQYAVGISFVSSGISRLVLAFAFRVVEPTEPPEPSQN